MAAVDFRNAVLQPFLYNPIDVDYVGINSNVSITDVSGTSLTSALTITSIQSTINKLLFNYSGTFNASGNTFYLHHPTGATAIHWKISGITFASGDTFNFQIEANFVY